MENNGFIVLHRKLLNWEWLDKPEMVSVFIYLLLAANHEPKQWHGLTIDRGQLVTGRRTLSKTLGISQQMTRTCIDRLKSTHEITTKSTNKFSIITIVKYSDYQDRKLKSTNKSTNKSPTSNQQSTTNNNENNENKKNKETFFLKPVDNFSDLEKEIKRLKNWNDNQSSPILNFKPENIIKKHGIDKVKRLREKYGQEDNGFGLFLTALNK